MPSGHRAPSLSPVAIRQIIELYQSGYSLREIARGLDLTGNQVYKTIQNEGIMRPRLPFTEEHLKNLSISHIGQIAWNTGIPHSEETRQLLSDTAWQNFQGGASGDYWALILCPIGFIREHRVYWAVELNLSIGDRQHKFFCLDFAILTHKIGIELDGPNHKTTPQEDWQRDEMLRYLGWEVFRLKHN